MNVDLEDASGGDVAVDTDSLVRQGRFLGAQLRLHPDTELSVRLVDTAEMEQLHVTWLDEPGPTDVLSFPMDELRVPAAGETAVAGMLGDIVLCPVVAQRQAAAAGHSTDDELALLLTHGLLHLLGYDHAEPLEHQEMFGLQGQLLTAWQEAAG